MGIEIEKKFLLADDSWRTGPAGKIYMQGYLCSGGPTVRVRTAGETGILTIKGRHLGISRLEFEYEIPLEEARLLMDQLCLPPIIHKTRYIREFEGFTWEIDEFYDDNEGLILAEIELDHEEQLFPKPPWLGQEVTEDGRYYNANLRTNPYKRWKDKA